MPRTELFDREKVLCQIRDLFWNKGYNGTSMQDLVETTGLNRSSLYNSFGSKQELYNLVLKQYQEAGKVHFDRALRDADNPKAAIRNIFEYAFAEMCSDTQQKGCFNLNCKAELSRTTASIRHILQQHEGATIKLFKDLVQEGQDHQVINTKKTATQYAYYLYSAFQGLRMTGILITEPETLKNIIDTTMDTLN